MTYPLFATLVLLKCMQMILRYIMLYGTNQIDQYFSFVYIEYVIAWASKWELKFSFDKCQLLQIEYNNSNISYKLGSHKISSCESAVDLGVTIQSSLKSSLYCSLVAKKAYIRAKLILKSFLSRNYIYYIRTFKCYVHRVLEYACVV